MPSENTALPPLLAIQQHAKDNHVARQIFLDGQLFLQSNDNVGLWDASLEVRQACRLSHHEGRKLVNLFIANGDYASVAPDVAGDIIHIDINQTLLDYFDIERDMLLQVFAEYQKHHSFVKAHDAVIAGMKKIAREHPVYRSASTRMRQRKESLGPRHFLADKTRYETCMQALQRKRVVTINLSLFSKDERDDFSRRLKKSGYLVNVVNLSNLADYDEQDHCIQFIEGLSYRDDDKQPIILWNFHDRGPEFNGERDTKRFYDHLLFVMRPNEFRDVYFRKFPRLLKQFDDARYRTKPPGAEKITRSHLPCFPRAQYMNLEGEDSEYRDKPTDVFHRQGYLFISRKTAREVRKLQRFVGQWNVFTEEEFDKLRFTPYFAKAYYRIFSKTKIFDMHVFNVLHLMFKNISDEIAKRIVDILEHVTVSDSPKAIVAVLRQKGVLGLFARIKEKAEDLACQASIPFAVAQCLLKSPNLLERFYHFLPQIQKDADYLCFMKVLRTLPNEASITRYLQLCFEHQQVISFCVFDYLQEDNVPDWVTTQVIAWLTLFNNENVLLTRAHVTLLVQACQSLERFEKIASIFEIHLHCYVVYGYKPFGEFGLKQMIALTKRPILSDFLSKQKERGPFFYAGLKPLLQKLECLNKEQLANLVQRVYSLPGNPSGADILSEIKLFVNQPKRKPVLHPT